MRRDARDAFTITIIRTHVTRKQSAHGVIVIGSNLAPPFAAGTVLPARKERNDRAHLVLLCSCEEWRSLRNIFS
jgi:hypothetical protein